MMKCAVGILNRAWRRSVEELGGPRIQRNYTIYKGNYSLVSYATPLITRLTMS